MSSFITFTPPCSLRQFLFSPHTSQEVPPTTTTPRICLFCAPSWLHQVLNECWGLNSRSFLVLWRQILYQRNHLPAG